MMLPQFGIIVRVESRQLCAYGLVRILGQCRLVDLGAGQIFGSTALASRLELATMTTSSALKG